MSARSVRFLLAAGLALAPALLLAQDRAVPRGGGDSGGGSRGGDAGSLHTSPGANSGGSSSSGSSWSGSSSSGSGSGYYAPSNAERRHPRAGTGHGGGGYYPGYPGYPGYGWGGGWYYPGYGGYWWPYGYYGFGELMVVQLIPFSVNHFLRDAEWADVSPSTWATNLENPWKWDNNKFKNKTASPC